MPKYSDMSEFLKWWIGLFCQSLTPWQVVDSLDVEIVLVEALTEQQLSALTAFRRLRRDARVRVVERAIEERREEHER